MAERNLLFDSYKFSLIVLVVIGHAFIFSGRATLINYLDDFIYSFHMPAFIFISGFFSRNINLKKWIKSSVYFFETYAIFQVLYILFVCEGISVTLKNVVFHSIWITWYLLGLIIWRFCILCIKNLPRKATIPLFVISILFSFSVGLFDDSYNILSLFRVVVFFPFFFLGYLCNENILMQIRQNRFKYLTILYIPIALLFVYYIQSDHLQFILYGHVSFLYFSSLSLPTVCMFRILAFTNALILVFVFLICIPKKLPFGLENNGKYTLVIFLFHVLIIKWISDFININPYINVILYSSVSLCICLLLVRFRYINYLINPVCTIFSKLKLFDYLFFV